MRLTVADTGVDIAPEYLSSRSSRAKEAVLVGGFRQRTGRPSLDESAEVAPRGGVRGEHRPELKIEGYLGIVVLDLGDARLARTHPPCQILLREVAALPERAHGISRREFGLHEGRFYVGRFEELGGACRSAVDAAAWGLPLSRRPVRERPGAPIVAPQP